MKSNSKKKEKVLLDFYKHIDNGGPRIAVYVEYHDGGDGCKWITSRLDMETSYFGYPSISVSLPELEADDFHKLGLEFLKVSEKLKEIEKEEGKADSVKKSA